MKLYVSCGVNPHQIDEGDVVPEWGEYGWYKRDEVDEAILYLEAELTQLRAERDLLREGHRIIDGFARSILEEPTNPNHVRMRAGNIRSWIQINAALTGRKGGDNE